MESADQVGEDGLLTYEEITVVPLLTAVAVAGLLTTAAAMRWVLCKVFRARIDQIDRAWDREYWAD